MLQRYDTTPSPKQRNSEEMSLLHEMQYTEGDRFRFDFVKMKGFWTKTDGSQQEHDEVTDDHGLICLLFLVNDPPEGKPSFVKYTTDILTTEYNQLVDCETDIDTDQPELSKAKPKAKASAKNKAKMKRPASTSAVQSLR